jgi:hypothetical protein
MTNLRGSSFRARAGGRGAAVAVSTPPRFSKRSATADVAWMSSPPKVKRMPEKARVIPIEPRPLLPGSGVVVSGVCSDADPELITQWLGKEPRSQ